MLRVPRRNTAKSSREKGAGGERRGFCGEEARRGTEGREERTDAGGGKEDAWSGQDRRANGGHRTEMASGSAFQYSTLATLGHPLPLRYLPRSLSVSVYLGLSVCLFLSLSISVSLCLCPPLPSLRSSSSPSSASLSTSSSPFLLSAELYLSLPRSSFTLSPTPFRSSRHPSLLPQSDSPLLLLPRSHPSRCCSASSFGLRVLLFRSPHS